MRYQGSEILNKFLIKIAQFLEYFCTNCCFEFETLSLSEKRATTVTHINLLVSIFFSSSLYTGSLSQNLIHSGLNHLRF